jgi:hypothetical protein
MRPLGRILFAVTLAAALFNEGGRLSAQTRTPQLHAGTLAQPRVTRDANGRVVISMEARGDLRRLITFELDPTGDGSTYAGKWALVVA